MIYKILKLFRNKINNNNYNSLILIHRILKFYALILINSNILNILVLLNEY
jgi:hypothetical protein